MRDGLAGPGGVGRAPADSGAGRGPSPGFDESLPPTEPAAPQDHEIPQPWHVSSRDALFLI
jgi:hypothetical protein